MRNRQLTLLLLFWLFSHQVFAALLSSSSTHPNCPTNSQSNCVIAASEHIGHFMPVISSTDSTADNENNLSIISDHCSAVCQSSVLSSSTSASLNTAHLIFDAQSIDNTVESFPKSLYRPPILV